MRKRRKISICIYIICGLLNIIGGIIEHNIFIILLGIMFFSEILTVLNNHLNEEFIDLQNQIISIKNANFVLLYLRFKPYIKNNLKLTAELNRHFIRILNEMERKNDFNRTKLL